MAFEDFVKNTVPSSLGSVVMSPGLRVADYFSNKQIEGVLNSVINSVTGAGLTGQQIAQNEYTAGREDSQYQRLVEDLRKAGLNPAMLFGHGAQPASSASASPSSNGASFSNMLELAALEAQIKNLNSQANLNDAAAVEKRSNTALNEQWFEFNKSINPLKVKAQEIANDLSREQRVKIKYETQKVIAEMEKIVAETETEASKQLYNMLAGELAQAEAWQIYELAPYKVKLMDAQTSHERAMASLAAVETMYKKGLIDGGYIDAMCDEMKSNARDADSRAAIDEFRRNISTGNAFSWDAETKLGKVFEQIVKGTLGYPFAAVDYLLDKINLSAFIGFTSKDKR